MIESEKITSKYIRVQPVFIQKKICYYKKQIFSGEKIREIQVILLMIMLTRYSERIFNPMRYTGLFICTLTRS